MDSPSTEQARLDGTPLSKTAVTSQLSAVETAVKSAQVNLGKNGAIYDPLLAAIVHQKHSLQHHGLEGVKSIQEHGVGRLRSLSREALEGMSTEDQGASDQVTFELDLLEKVLAQPIEDVAGAPNPVSATPGATRDGGHTLYPDPAIARGTQKEVSVAASAAAAATGTNLSNP